MMQTNHFFIFLEKLQGLTFNYFTVDYKTFSQIF